MKARESQGKGLLAGKWPGERRGPEGLLAVTMPFSVKGQVARVPGFGYVVCCTLSSSLFSSFFSFTMFVTGLVFGYVGFRRCPGSSPVAARGLLSSCGVGAS